MRLFTILLLLLGIAACQTDASVARIGSTSTSITFSDTDGLTKKTAIVITGAKNSAEGVDAEYEWIDQHLPGSTVESTSLERGDGIYDVFDITLPSGKTRIIYFDITSFMHKK